MRKFASTLRPVSALLRASLLAGFLCVPYLALADNATTNVVLYDDWVDYHDRIVEECNTIIGEAALLSSQLTIINDGLSASQRKISDAASAAAQFQFSDYDEYVVVRDALDDARDQVAAQQSTLSDLQAELNDIRSAAYRIQIDMPVFTPADFEGGGCDCPDYTAYIDELEDLLSSINVALTDLSDQTLYWYFKDQGDGWYQFWHDAARRLGNIVSEGNYDSYAFSGTVGNFFGTVLSNDYYRVYWLDTYSSLGNGVFDSVTSGPKYLQEMWNYILRPFAQTWADYEWDPDNRMIHGFRDFYIGDHIVAVTNEPENPIWVEFTNSVSLSEETLAALTNTFFSLDDLMHSLTTAVFMVTWDEDTMEKQQEVEQEMTQQAAIDAADQHSDPDRDTVALPSADVFRASGIGTHVSSVVNSYKSMFNSIPHQLPSDIMVHEGFTMRMLPGSTRDDFEVQSIHWRPGQYSKLSTLLGGIRACFVGFWLIIYIAVIWGAMAIDIFVAGVCIYCTYGLLLGKPETAVKGIRYMFGVLCSLLGREPPK